MRELLPYRPGVGIMLLNNKNQVFVGQRIDTRSDTWQMPQGGIDDNETAADAALRELEEETGCNKGKIIVESKDWFYYDVPDYLIPKLWNGKYRGQKQKWFAIRFLGTDNEFDLNSNNHAEFSSWRWVDIPELLSIIVPFKRKLYEEVINEFRPALEKLD
jgi:putative (di)nucleoside polyphosphate hydrolase